MAITVSHQPAIDSHQPGQCTRHTNTQGGDCLID
jgi:hypothetical protein